MRDAVDENRVETRIGKNDLLAAARGGVAVERGFDVDEQQLLNARQLGQQLGGRLLCAQRDAFGQTALVIGECEPELRTELLINAGQHVTGEIRRGDARGLFLAEIAGE